MHIEIYTDGGCSGNPGPGGWGFVILSGDKVIKGSGREDNTTNNRMELSAVINALNMLKRLKASNPDIFSCSSSYNKTPRSITVFTDSVYVRKGITEWIEKWIRNGWKTSDKKDVKNRDLWKNLKELSDIFLPEWVWVKGHSGNKWNEECDLLVKQEIFGKKQKN